MIDKFETDQILLYFPVEYMMHFKPPVMCPMSHVLCLVSHATFNHPQTVRARDLQFSHNIRHTLCVMCLVSHVRCHMSPVICHMSLVTCQMSCDTFLFFYFLFFFLQIVGVSWWRGCYRRGLPLLVFIVFLLKTQWYPFFF